MTDIKDCNGKVIYNSEAQTLREAVIAAVRGRADLSRADLSRADLHWAYLSGANLSGAHLSGAHIVLGGSVAVFS